MKFQLTTYFSVLIANSLLINNIKDHAAMTDNKQPYRVLKELCLCATQIYFCVQRCDYVHIAKGVKWPPAMG